MQKNTWASLCGAAAAELATFPLCTIQTNYQLSSKTMSIPQIIKEIYQVKGLRGFYYGVRWAVCSQMLSTSSKYVLYRKLQQTYTSNVACAALAGFCSSLLTQPFDYVKVNLQIRTAAQRKTFLSSLSWKTLYTGWTKTMTKAVVGNTIYFPIFDFAKDKWQPLTSSVIPAAASTAILGSTVTHAFDFIKRRHQALGKTGWFLGYNPLSYMKGITMQWMRVVPHFTIQMSVIDGIVKLI